MCNNYRLHVPANQLAAPFAALGRPLTMPLSRPNLEPGDYRIGDRAPIVVTGEDGPQLEMTPWAWKAPNHGWPAMVKSHFVFLPWTFGSVNS